MKKTIANLHESKGDYKQMKMKKAAALAVSTACIIGALTACGNSSSTSSNSSGSSGDNGSAAAEASSSSESSGNLSGAVSTNGSTSMESVIGTLSEQFMKQNPNVSITYDATGSGTGIEAVSKGTCDIGLASRDLKDEEKSKGLESKEVALDGIAIIVNKDNKMKDISLKDLADIYEGKQTDWSAYNAGSGTIAAIGREAGSGTRDGFESITGTENKCKLSQELTSTGAVIEAVKNSDKAIGYASYADVKGKDVKILTVEGVKISEKTISDGSYKIQRPFNLITVKGKKLSTQAQAFYDYMTSTAANDGIKSAGAVPVAK